MGIPYDGNQIGAHFGDALRFFSGHARGWVGDVFHDMGGCFSIITGAHANMIAWHEVFPVETGSGFNFNPSLVVPTAHENRPVSISALICMSY